MSMNVGSGSGSGDPEVIVDINTTPLIDVMLVLLIMLIITIPIQLHSINMNMPVGNPPPPLKPPDIVRIDVDFDGTIIWNQQVVQSKAELEEKFKVIAAMPDQSEIHLRPHAKASYKHVASVMASAQRLGAVKIGLVGNEQFMN
jgi:biopolymer transport protein ExbD